MFVLGKHAGSATASISGRRLARTQERRHRLGVLVVGPAGQIAELGLRQLELIVRGRRDVVLVIGRALFVGCGKGA